ncbi:MAG: hypothetical protein CMJ29_13100 [Phycisphaerae bacterium]|nr:hypothetical protein [Phycisphaerae bacterium]
MNIPVATFASLALMAGTGLASSADGDLEFQAVQWTQESGGNGHWYVWVELAEGYSWSACRTAAENMGGHLVVAPDVSERTWCRNTFPESFAIGLYQDTNAFDYSEPAGGWRWVDGTPVTNDMWCIGEPDDGGGQDCAAGFYAVPNACVATGFCNQSFPAMLVEFSEDCNDDGIVDYGQILDGSLADVDGNGIPDLCEQTLDMGACCLGGTCVVTTAAHCFDAQGSYAGDGITCDSAACPTACQGDIDGDGQIGVTDILIMIDRWGACL